MKWHHILLDVPKPNLSKLCHVFQYWSNSFSILCFETGRQLGNGLSSVIRTLACCSCNRDQICSALSFAPRKTISTRPLAVWSTPRVAPAEPHPLQQTWIIADSNDFVLGSLSRLKMCLWKPWSSMNRTRKEMEKSCGTYSLTTPTVATHQNWNKCQHFLSHGTAIVNN